MNFYKLCPPAYFYIVISIICLIINSFVNFSFMSIIINTVIIILWSLFLNFLCIKGLINVAWLLVLLPPLISMIYYLTLYIKIPKISK